MGKKYLLGCGLPLLLISLLLVWGVRNLLKAAPKPERFEIAQVGDVEIKVVETGTIEPLHKVEVKSKVGGRVARLLVEEGARVQQGQALAHIDPQEINTQVAALEAQLAAAQARLAAAQKNTNYQQSQTSAGIAQYEQNAASALARLRSAESSSNAQPQLTQQAIEIAQANLDAARSTLKAQQSALRLMVESTHPQNVVSAQAAYDQAAAQAENAAHTLKRQRQLLEKGFVSQQAVDAATADAAVAESRKQEAKARFDRIQQTNELEEANLRSQVASAAGQVKQMEGALAQARMSVLPDTMRREMESARAAYAQAKAQLDAARSGKTQDKIRADEAVAAAADVRQIDNQLKERLVQQHDTTLYASMPGVVTKRYVEEGELITSGIESFSSGTPVYQVSDLSTMLIKVNVNEVDIEKVKVGLPVEVTIDASRGVIFQGRIRKVAPSALSDATSGSSGGSGGGGQTVIRFPVEVQIDHADPRLKPGMSARCAIYLARRRNVLRLPSNCVQGVGDTATVQIVTSEKKDGKDVEKVAARTVKVGLRGDDFVEIVSGLKAGEKVRPNPYSGPPRKEINVDFGDDHKRD